MSNSDQEVRELYRKHVPEVACGVVEVVAVAREVGQYTMVAVRSHDSCIDPLSACVGKGAVLSKAIMRELGGGIRVVLWSESVREFIERTMLCRKRGPLRSPKVTLDETTHQAHVQVEPETVEYMTSREGLFLRLASRLVGWDIQLVPYGQGPVA
jgi:N utilization substance protein A